MFKILFFSNSHQWLVLPCRYYRRIMRVNLKKLIRHRSQEHSRTMYILLNFLFKLTKFINDYFAQNDIEFGPFIKYWPPQLFYRYSGGCISYRLEGYGLILKRFDCQMWNSCMEYRPLVLYNRLESLVIFLKRRTDGKQSHFVDIMDFFTEKAPHIKRLEIY